MQKSTGHRGRTGAQTAGRALILLEYIAEQREPVSAAQAARDLQIEPSAVHRSLAELEARGFVLRENGSALYVVGTSLVRLAATVLSSLDLLGAARQAMEQIAARTRETVSLHRASGLERVAIDVVPGTHEISRFVPVGETVAIYSGPSGKAIMAFLGESALDAALGAARDGGVDTDRLEDELADIRRQGYAASVGDRTPGVGGLSVPIFGPTKVLASVTVSGVGERWGMDAMHEAAGYVVPLVAEVSERLGVPRGVELDGANPAGMRPERLGERR